jgi:hypothetical protein
MQVILQQTTLSLFLVKGFNIILGPKLPTFDCSRWILLEEPIFISANSPLGPIGVDVVSYEFQPHQGGDCKMSLSIYNAMSVRARNSPLTHLQILITNSPLSLPLNLFGTQVSNKYYLVSTMLVSVNNCSIPQCNREICLKRS